MKKLFVFIAVALIAPIVSMAQISSERPVPQINVSMSVDTLVMPDVFYLSITVVDNKGVGKQGIDNVERRILIPTLRREGVDIEKDLVIDNVYSTYNKRGKDVTSKRYTLMIKSASKTNRIVSKLKSEDILVSLQRTDVSNKKELEAELRIKALKAAKLEAKRLLSAVGPKSGKLLMVNVNIYNHLQPRQHGGMMMKSNVEFESVSIDKFEKVGISANIQAAFEIL